MQLVRIAVPAKEGENPFLLLGGEEAFAMMVAVVGGVSAQVGLDVVAQGRVVFPFHLGKKGLEAVGGVDDARWPEAGAGVALAGGGIDCRAHHPAVGEVLAGKVACATVGHRAVGLEAAVVGRRNLVGGQWDVCFHNFVVDRLMVGLSPYKSSVFI